MIAGALEHVRLAVEQETLVRVETHRADAEFRLDAISDLPGARDHRDQMVELR